MNEAAQFWDERSSKFGARIEGVLLKSVPKNINFYLNSWMLKQVLGVLDKRNGYKVLDIGCGYGRLSEPILKKFPDLQIFGVDLAENYVDLYNKKLKPRGEAVVADSRDLPFEDIFFDAVFMVTALMYLTTEEDQIKALKEMIRVLKPGGKFLILERSVLGYNIFTFGGVISKIRGKKNLEIPAVSFSPDFLSKVISKCGGTVKECYGLPLFTISFPVALALSIISTKLGGYFLKFIGFVDNLISKFYYPSLYISYKGEKNG